jgi:ADP-heptose:LPS heptosyltransferase
MSFISNITEVFKKRQKTVSYIENISKINFTKILSNPQKILVILSSDMIDFLQSLTALSLLLNNYSNTTLLVPEKDYLSFLERCLRKLNFDYYLYKENKIPDEITNETFDLIIILAKEVTGETKSYLRESDQSIKAGLDDFLQLELINHITRTEKSQSRKEKYFNQICGLIGKSPISRGDMSRFQVQLKISDDKLKVSRKILDYLDVSKIGRWIFLDISSGMNSTTFSEKQLCQLIKLIQDRTKASLFLLDWNEKRYDKLRLKGLIQKPFFISEQDIYLLTAHLANAKMIISPNSKLFHIAQLVNTKTVGVFLPKEKEYFFKTNNNLEFVVNNFRYIHIGELVDSIVEFYEE